MYSDGAGERVKERSPSRKIAMKRARAVHHEHRVVHDENEFVYASDVSLNGTYEYGLFSKVDIEPGTALGEYNGKILDPVDVEGSNSKFLMNVRDPDDLRKRLVIDGDIHLYKNICGYANYAMEKYANAYVVDMTEKNKRCRVVLYSKCFIPRGTEIRFDYDRGTRKNPYRRMLIHEGILAGDDKTYQSIIYDHPRTSQ